MGLGIMSGGLSYPSGSSVPSTQKVVAAANVTLHAAGDTLYSVTAGKKFYVQSIAICNGSGAYQVFQILDNATILATLACTAAATGTSGFSTVSFPTPLIFSTSVKLIANADAANSYYSVVGYEQ